MGMFDKIEEAKYSEGGNYLKPGVYRLQISKVSTFKTRKGPNAFCGEFNVLESSNPEHLVGSSVSWMTTDDKEPFLGNVKQFIAIAAGTSDLSQVDKETAELAVSDDQPLTNKIVRASATLIKTKRQTDFTKVKFLLDAVGAAGAAKAHAEDAK